MNIEYRFSYCCVYCTWVLVFSTQFVNDPVTTRTRTTRSNIAPQHSRMKVPIHVKFPYWPINKKNICWKQLDHINSNAFQPYVIYGDTWYWTTLGTGRHAHVLFTVFVLFMKLWDQSIIVIQTVSIHISFPICLLVSFLMCLFSDFQNTVQTNGVGLFGSSSTVPDSDLQQAPTPRDSPQSLSLSQVSIATQDIENAMLEINFGNPLNNLNK